MKLVRNRADARWLPSRHSFAIFRLLSWFRLRASQPRTTAAMFFVDRHQSTVETWTVGLWLLATSGCYFAEFLFPHRNPAWTVPFGVWLSLGILQIVFIISGLTIAPLWNAVTRRRTLPLRVNGFLIMLLLFAASAWGGVRPGWIRYVAWSALSTFALNALAFVVLLVLRDSVAHLEASVIGGSSSES